MPIFQSKECQKGASEELGLTLIELMVAVAIIGILLQFAASNYSAYIERTKVYEAATTITAISGTISDIISSSGIAPESLDKIGAANLIDPWGFKYRYNANINQKGNGGVRKDRNLNPINSDFDLYSVGKDGATSQSLIPKASQDDVIRANNGRYIGLAKDY